MSTLREQLAEQLSLLLEDIVPGFGSFEHGGGTFFTSGDCVFASVENDLLPMRSCCNST